MLAPRPPIVLGMGARARGMGAAAGYMSPLVVSFFAQVLVYFTAFQQRALVSCGLVLRLQPSLRLLVSFWVGVAGRVPALNVGLFSCGDRR